MPPIACSSHLGLMAPVNTHIFWKIFASAGRSWLHLSCSPASCSCKDSRRSLLEDNKGLGSGTNAAPAMRPPPRIRCFSSSQLALLPSPSPRDDTVTDQLLAAALVEPPSCGIFFVSGFSSNELNQKQTTQAITAPPDEVCISAQRIFCPPWPQFLRRKKYFRRN